MAFFLPFRPISGQNQSFNFGQILNSFLANLFGENLSQRISSKLFLSLYQMRRKQTCCSSVDSNPAPKNLLQIQDQCVERKEISYVSIYEFRQATLV